MPAPMTTTRAEVGTEAIPASSHETDLLRIMQRDALSETGNKHPSPPPCLSRRTAKETEDGAAGSREKAQVPCSQEFTMSGWASIHFLAAAVGSILSFAMYSATVFWSSLVQWKFFTSVIAGEPESANFLEISLLRLYGG